MLSLNVFVAAIVFIPISDSALLHESCSLRSDECKTELSHCDATTNKCVCRPYTVEYNSTTCLAGKLLGFQCVTDMECQAKIPTSSCVNHVCSCGAGYVPFRRHTCLPPANFGEICFENDQCALADPNSQCGFVVPRVFGKCNCNSGSEYNGQYCISKGIKIGDKCESDSECTIPQAYCQRKLDGNRYCTCEVSFSPSTDYTRCLPTYRGLFSATSLGYPCIANLQCQLSDPNSICTEGICECSAYNSTTCNSKNTGCHRSTFQCHGDGSCISYYFLCDGKKDCADGSDELCYVSEQCPKQAFQCKAKKYHLNKDGSGTSISNGQSIKCISRGKLCDGVADCDDGEDEKDCTGKESCPPGTFKCSTTNNCLPEYQFCNGVGDCKDLSDENEKECRLEFQPAEFCPFRCANGLCRSSAIVCSGVNGCGDSSDEQSCSVCRCPRPPEKSA